MYVARINLFFFRVFVCHIFSLQFVVIIKTMKIKYTQRQTVNNLSSNDV